MQQLIASGRIADLILAIMAIEAMLILLVLRPPDLKSKLGVIGNLAAGAGLVLALRTSLTGGDWYWIAGFLMVAMAGHIVDLAARTWNN